MKRTAYQITGQSFEMPAAHLLPDGLEVKAVTVDLPAVEVTGALVGHALKVWEIHPGRRVAVTVHTPSGEAGMSVDLDSARQVRDCLNAILGDDESSPRPVASAPGSDEDQGRVFKDFSGDLWFEVEPNAFTIANDWKSAREGGTHGSDFAGWTLDLLEREYPDVLVDITHTYQEDSSSSAPSSPDGDSGLGDEEPKVYREGDPKPEYSCTRRLLDSGQKRLGGNVYRRLWRGGDPLFHAEGRSGWSWSELLKDYGPLTEVNP